MLHGSEQRVSQQLRGLAGRGLYDWDFPGAMQDVGAGTKLLVCLGRQGNIDPARFANGVAC